jgi:hypothetical protein
VLAGAAPTSGPPVLVRARRDLLAGTDTARQQAERLATGSAMTRQMAAARRGQQDTGIKEPR